MLLLLQTPLMIVSEADCMIISCGLFYKICNLAIEFKSEIHPVTVDRDLQKKKKKSVQSLSTGGWRDDSALRNVGSSCGGPGFPVPTWWLQFHRHDTRHTCRAHTNIHVGKTPISIN